jgi:hypothetical protein
MFDNFFFFSKNFCVDKENPKTGIKNAIFYISGKYKPVEDADKVTNC